MRLKIIAYNLKEYEHKVNAFAQTLIDPHTTPEQEAAVLGLKELGGSTAMEVLCDTFFGRFDNTLVIRTLACDSLMDIILTSNDIAEMGEMLFEMNGLPRTEGRDYWGRNLSPQKSLRLLSLLLAFAKDELEREKILLITTEHNTLFDKYLLEIDSSEKAILQREAEILKFCNELGINPHKTGFFAIIHARLAFFFASPRRFDVSDLDRFKAAFHRSKDELACWVEKEKDLDDEHKIIVYRTLYLLRKSESNRKDYWNGPRFEQKAYYWKTFMIAKLTIPSCHEEEHNLLMRHLQKSHPEATLNDAEYQRLSEYLQSINKNILDYTPENINALLNEFD